MTSAAPQIPSSRAALGTPAAIMAMVGWSASGVISKGLADLGPLAVTFWRMWLYTAIVLLFLRLNGSPLKMSSIKVSFWGGFSLAFDIMFFFLAIRLTTIANATVVGTLQPVLMLFLAPRLFGEKPRPRHWLLNFVAISGVAIVVFGSSGLPDWSPLGDLVAFFTLFAWTGYFVFAKISCTKISAPQYTGASALVCSIVVTPFALVSGQAFEAPTAGAWFWLAILAVGPGFASHMLMNWSLVHIPAWFGSTLTLAIPVTTTLLAWAFLDERVALMQFVGMAVVMVALSMVVVDQTSDSRRSKEQAAEQDQVSGQSTDQPPDEPSEALTKPGEPT